MCIEQNAQTIKYKLYKDQKLISVSYSLTTDEFLENPQSVNKVISKDISFYKSSGTLANKILIYVDNIFKNEVYIK